MPRRQRNVPLTEEDGPQRKASSGTIRSEGGLSHYSKSGIWQIHDSTDSLQSPHRGSMRTKHGSGSSQEGSSRFPKLEECAHFHYDFVDFGPLQVSICDDDRENYRHNEEERREVTVLVRVSCNNKAWTVRRTLSHFSSLDRQLHRCIFDRKFSQLPELHAANTDVKNSQEVDQLLQGYLRRFTELAGTMINCGSILNWLEMDNRGNRLLAVDDSGINTPAIAAAHAVKRYTAQAADEISLQVGDIVSVIDMPPAEDTIWWRGKRGFEVGFFPSECVEVIGDKVPPSMATCMPATGSLSTTSPGNTLTPVATPATARKPCEIDNAEDTASMMRKHGKLMSFLRTFFSTRPPRNQLKQSGIVKERVFGCDLGEHLLNSGHDVPVVLKSCTEVIERYGIVDGIYRLSGITSNIQKLRVAFDEDQVPELMESTYLQDIHSISSLLKMYFRELPNPLLTYQLYDKFAEAVKDEDNKLLRIHDVVQQLPPPHYRTLEYLMRHLGRVASHAFETGMHSKNLAIVWAPNLLRSKELELGGGAAALQGVGIQAVVTECLICYCDLIFNDKMPSYNSPHLHKSQKKPRPKSLAISTPTRLLSLEEARERAFIGSLAHSQRFIDVGGGPASLPATYHTVIDLPGYRKKANKDANKGKKSPVSGWKSIFSKPRSGSVKKTRKGSVQGDYGCSPCVFLGCSSVGASTSGSFPPRPMSSMPYPPPPYLDQVSGMSVPPGFQQQPPEEKPLGSVQAKALTEEDVHNWKRRLRSAKSAESLLSMTASARSSISSQTSSSISNTDAFRQREELLSPHHKRSLSSDASTIIHHYHHISPHLESVSSPTRQSSAEAQPESLSSPGSHRSRTDKRTDPPRKQSFVRGDSTRKALHRRTPSAPNTPRLDRNAHTSSVNSQHKASSQPRLDSLPSSPNSDSSLLTSPVDTSLGIDIDAAIKARLQQMAMQSRSARSSDSSPKSPEKQPLGGGRGEREKRKAELENGVVELQASPGSHRRHDPASPMEQAKFFVSRYHDYAEILSDEEGGREVSAPSSTTDMQELVEKLDSKLSSAAKFYLRDGEDTSEPEAKHAKLEPERTDAEMVTHVSNRLIERVPASSGRTDSPPSTQVLRRRAEWIPSESALTAEQVGADAEFPELPPRSAGSRDAALPPIPHSRNRHAAQQRVSPSQQQESMSKCLSVPSDIARSLENVTASQNDLLSSVTISELSQSINSFCTSAQDDSPHREDPRWRRSTSLDSLEAEGSLCRTLRAINAQMDSAFHLKVDRALQLEEKGYSRHVDSDSSSLTPLHISEDNLATPTAVHETHFPATSGASTANEKSVSPTAHSSVQETMPRSVSDNRHLGREGMNIAMSQSYPAPDHHPDYAVITKRQPASKPEGGFGSPDPDYAVVSKRHGVCEPDGGFGLQPDFPDYAIIAKKQAVFKPDGDFVSQQYNFAGEQAFSDQLSVGSALSSTTAAKMLQPSVLESEQTDSLQWPQGGEAFADTAHLFAHIPQHSVSKASGRLVADPSLEGRMPKLDVGAAVSDLNTPRSPASVARADARAGAPKSASVVEQISQSEVSSGVCVVKRQRQSSSSSSGSTSSSDAGDNSDDSIEIVHQARSADAQFAMKLRSKQRAAESLPPLSGPTDPPHTLPVMETTGVPVPHNRTDIPGDLRQFSPDDVLWRQSPLFGRSGDSGDLGNPESASQFNFSEVNKAEPRSPKRTGQHGVSSRVPRSFSQTSEKTSIPPDSRGSGMVQSYEGQPRGFSQPSEHKREPLSPRQEVRHQTQHFEGHPQASSQFGSVIKLQHEDLPIISGNVHVSSPASQQSHIPPPQSPTMASPPTYHPSRLPSPRSPVISSSSAAQQSRIPSPRSPTITSPSSFQQSNNSSASQSSTGNDSSSGVPLHLMLYHPDEFQVPPAAVGAAAGSPLPEVHVKSDTIMEEKAVIKKGGSSRAAQEQTGPGWGPVLELPQQNLKSLPTEINAFQGPPAEGGMQLGKAEQDSMEVDNLCNRLVDELHAVSNLPADVDLDEDTLLSAPARGSVQVEAVVERRIEESPVGGEAIVEQRLVRVESFGEVQDEEMENALNVGKEMLLAHSPASSANITSIATSTTTTTVLSGSSQPYTQSSAKPTHERRPSASKIPRFHKRTDSREEKSVVSDVSQGDVSQSSVASFSSVSCTSENRTGGSSKSRDSVEQSKSFAPRASKIPLSQKMPSPTSSFREPKVSKSATSPSSPRPTAPSVNKSSGQGKTQPSPIPRTRTSIHKSDHVPPPAAEVVEIARPSVKKRTSLNQKGDRNVAAAKERGDKNVIVQELKMDKGDAKLVIEKQPSLKKKIQTVHARKVPHPPRQIAEALDTDTCDSPPAELSSTGPSDMEHSGMSSQEDEVFSDESLRLGVGRDRSYSSGMGVRSPRSPRQPTSPSPLLPQRSETYQQMAASRSSLDDSALQLAAERYDDLIPNWEGREEGGYSTGSLRTRRSLKMRNLMEVFEKGTASNGEDSGDTKVKDQSDSTSGSTTISIGSQDREVDTDDDIFQPPCRRLPSSIVSRRSRSRERGGRGGNQAPSHRRTSQSPTARRPSSGRGDESFLRRRRPSPLNRNNTEDRPRASNKTEGGVGFGRPPRYRSASRGRTYSDSSTSESDNTQHFDSSRTVDSPSRPRGLPRGRAGRHEEGLSSRTGRQEDTMSGRFGKHEESSSGHQGSQEEEEEGDQRRGSIKELRQLFEKTSKDESKDSGSELSPPIPVRRSIRTRSVSPSADNSSQTVMANVMRRSLEIPTSSSMLKQRETPLTSQPLRLGPKPFYGSKK